MDLVVFSSYDWMSECASEKLCCTASGWISFWDSDTFLQSWCARRVYFLTVDHTFNGHSHSCPDEVPPNFLCLSILKAIFIPSLTISITKIWNQRKKLLRNNNLLFHKKWVGFWFYILKLTRSISF